MKEEDIITTSTGMQNVTELLYLAALLLGGLGHGEGVTQDGELGTGADQLPFPSQGSEAQSGVLDFRAFQASPLSPTSLGHQGTSVRLGYLAWKVSGAHTLWAGTSGHRSLVAAGRGHP